MSDNTGTEDWGGKVKRILMAVWNKNLVEPSWTQPDGEFLMSDADRAHKNDKGDPPKSGGPS
jgi:hypothetical protein